MHLIPWIRHRGSEHFLLRKLKGAFSAVDNI
jgi:hypothetical protein